MQSSSTKMSLFVALVLDTSAMTPLKTVKDVLTRDGNDHNLRLLSGYDKEIDGVSYLAALAEVSSEAASDPVSPEKKEEDIRKAKAALAVAIVKQNAALYDERVADSAYGVALRRGLSVEKRTTRRTTLLQPQMRRF